VAYEGILSFAEWAGVRTTLKSKMSGSTNRQIKSTFRLLMLIFHNLHLASGHATRLL
jgi:hypothetical protein